MQDKRKNPIPDYENIFYDEKDKKNNLSARLVYNNPELERYVNNQLKKINALIDDIKANIYEGEEKL